MVSDDVAMAWVKQQISKQKDYGKTVLFVSNYEKEVIISALRSHRYDLEKECTRRLHLASEEEVACLHKLIIELEEK
jgi:hypothetical protein